MQMIRFTVTPDSRYRSIDGFQVYGDGGTGVMDWEHPITPRRLAFWNDAVSASLHLAGGHLVGAALDSVRIEGHLAGTHLLDTHEVPTGEIAFETGPFVYGRFRHAVVTEDELGNATRDGVVVYETVVNSDPPGASDLKAVAHERATGVLTLSFQPSERLVG